MSGELDLDLDALRKTASCATNGPWRRVEVDVHQDDIRTGPRNGLTVPVASVRSPRGNADHIAAFDPPTVLALLDWLQAAERRTEAAETETAEWRERYETVTRSRAEWRERAETAEAKLRKPCGTCHPCNNWPAATWAQAGESLPTVDRWQALKEQAEAAQRALDEHRCDEQAERAYQRALTAEAKVRRVREAWDEYNSNLGGSIPPHYRDNIHAALEGDPR